MKMEDAIADLVMEFGTDKEKTMCDKVTAVFIKAVGNRDVPDGVMKKVVAAGRALRRMGIS